MSAADRSTSRGREFLSSGRGGIGNIRPSSNSRDTRPTTGPDDFSQTRGREPRIQAATEQIFSTGRGGAGNMRSPSRDPASPTAASERENEIIRKSIAAEENAPHSSGRGGLGNITGNRSRSRDGHVTPIHSSGRGGAGNMHLGHAISETIDEEERKKLGLHHTGIHSTGRGGAANLTSAPEPAVEHTTHKAHAFESTGRGGAGNIHTPSPAPQS
ncbi:hypothetical protein CPB83DRAFT_839520 [Crepidotus variabilis]|uniref:Uncharacterized protein n=1 Tax=Crepidotus variabilis TaxID=179855 RepID=A0A9P6E6Z1_9AGAR|nr:hypothetical protein CPB83DRAFT_839520 [Crepidotus variabilis]